MERKWPLTQFQPCLLWELSTRTVTSICGCPQKPGRLGGAMRAFGRKSARVSLLPVQKSMTLGVDWLPGNELSASSSNRDDLTRVISSCESYSIHFPPAPIPWSCAKRTAAAQSRIKPAINAFKGNFCLLASGMVFKKVFPELALNFFLIFRSLAELRNSHFI